jgi:hypothetical protein
MRECVYCCEYLEKNKQIKPENERGEGEKRGGNSVVKPTLTPRLSAAVAAAIGSKFGDRWL